MREIIENMSSEEFARLCNRLVTHMGFKIRKSVYRENVVVLDAYMHVPGSALHYVIVFLRKPQVTREDLMDIIFSEETVELRWMIITTGYFEEEAKTLQGENVTLMDWKDFERLLNNFGMKEELERSKRGEEAREGRYLPSAGELDSLLQWAREFMEKENYEKALEYVNRALKIKETSTAKKLQAKILHNLGRSEEAVPLLTSVLEGNVEDDEAWFLLGEVLEAMNNLEEAERAYEQCIKFNSRNIGCWINRGNIMVEMEKYQEALLCYENALRLRENIPEVWSNRGVVLKHLGKYDEALQSYNTALKLNPDFAEAYLNKAYLYFDKKKYEKAQNEVVEYLKRRNDARGWLLLAQIYLKRGREKDAEESLKKVLELEPGNLEARELFKRIKTSRDYEGFAEEMEKIKKSMIKVANALDENIGKEIEEKLSQGKIYDAWISLVRRWEDNREHLEREKDMLRNALIEGLRILAKREGVRLGNLKRMKSETLINALKKFKGEE